MKRILYFLGALFLFMSCNQEVVNKNEVREYVDLGLSVCWATCNIGGASPEDYGDYFAWGETEPKEHYDMSTYKWCTGDNGQMTKYCTRSGFGTVDNKTCLDLEDDAAYVNWDKRWRMPTKEEFQELHEQCDWTWTSDKGVNGYMVTSKKNGQCIFLPASGYREGKKRRSEDEEGDYMTSTLGVYPIDMNSMYFGAKKAACSDGRRYDGRSVRPVCNIHAKVVTVETSAISDTLATVVGEVVADNGFDVFERGVVYSTSKEPTLEDKKVISGRGVGTYSAELCGLVEGTTYYVRAYAKNSECVSYGDELIFLTTTMHNGHEYIDLGLSVKWATCNVGASQPEEYGDYFAWGETRPKSTYNWSTYKWCNGSYTSLTKYCTKGYYGPVDNYYGPVDNKTQLELSDDAARANWGGSWRMPTHDELNELKEKCTWTWTTQNGMDGYKVTSKTNGRSIFLPASGYRGGGSLYSAGSYGCYWSSSLETDGPYSAVCVYFDSSNVGWYGNGHGRNLGQSVRPVCP